jgi:DNA-binding NarL/FixJ family response regulator
MHIHVFLISQNRLLREALGRLLTKQADIRIAVATEYDVTTRQRVIDCRSEMLLLEHGASIEEDLRTISLISRDLPSLKLLVLGTDEDHEAFLCRANSRLMGFVSWDASGAELAVAIQRGIAPVYTSGKVETEVIIPGNKSEGTTQRHIQRHGGCVQSGLKFCDQDHCTRRERLAYQRRNFQGP